MNKVVNYFLRKNLKFKIITERDLNTTEFRNLKFLYRYMDTPTNYDTYSEKIKNLLSNPKKISEVLFTMNSGYGKNSVKGILPVLWHMIAKKHVKIDLKKPLSTSTILFLNEKSRS